MYLTIELRFGLGLVACNCASFSVITSAVKRLIAINRIQNKSVCLHNRCVYTVYIFMYV